MDESSRCSQAKDTECPGPGAPECSTCPRHGSWGLADVLARFWREGISGVCETPRYRMPFLSWGNGPPLVFIHGVGDTRFSFIQTIARLSAYFRCIAYDMPNGYDDRARLWRYGHQDL